MTKLIGLAIAAASLAPASAHAVPAPLRTAIVQTADLDLNTMDGRARLDLRLRQAAQTVCGTASDIDLAGQNRAVRCRRDTLRLARSQAEIAFVRPAAPSTPLSVAAK